jgi:hypothetical protein
VKRALANFFLSLATSLGAQRVTVNVIREPFSPATTEAVLLRKDWQAESAQSLETFLRSAHGQLFFARLHAVAGAVAVGGARNTANTIHAAGVSAGWDECVRYIHTLSRVSGVQDTTTEQAPQSEASLLETLSP